ncbi:hypothetical protein [Nostoc sp. WHI]|uniref:hypothetical protein n=1 Tax=Nostoc sp. WHI TaxID=2650611 RepID=UPI0018C76548|nr:hypothetical protein [Nostoc sp. WHI]
MKASNGNIKLKIFRRIFAIVNLVLISGGLVSCVVQAPNPLAPTEQQKPALEPNQAQPNHKSNDDNDSKDKDDDDNDSKLLEPNFNAVLFRPPQTIFFVIRR